MVFSIFEKNSLKDIINGKGNYTLINCKMSFDTQIFEDKMNKSLENLKKDLNGLRTGRASVSLLEPINVDAYGSKVPLSQISNISVPESRMITVQVWDETLVNTVENTIRNSDLGLNPMIEGNLIRVPVPELSEERRIEIVKIAAKYSEDCKISVRNIRREGMDKIKIEEKNKELSKDESFSYSEDLQGLTDKFIKKLIAFLKKRKKIF